MIAKMAAGTEMGRLLVWRAAWLKNQGLRNTRETSLAKWHATEHAVQTALDAIQVHGANGYSNEFPVERYLRNSKAAVIYEGTSQLHTLIQADYALGYREDRPLRCEPWPAQGWERPGMTRPDTGRAGRSLPASAVDAAIVVAGAGPCRRDGVRAVASGRRRPHQRQSAGRRVWRCAGAGGRDPARRRRGRRPTAARTLGHLTRPGSGRACVL